MKYNFNFCSLLGPESHPCMDWCELWQWRSGQHMIDFSTPNLTPISATCRPFVAKSLIASLKVVITNLEVQGNLRPYDTRVHTHQICPAAEPAANWIVSAPTTVYQLLHQNY